MGARELAAWILSKDAADHYGVPLLEAYDRFDPLGSDDLEADFAPGEEHVSGPMPSSPGGRRHGTLIMALGSQRQELSVRLKSDLAKAIAPGAPVELSGSGEVKGGKGTGSAVVLFRTSASAGAPVGRPARQSTLVGRLDGPTGTFSGTLTFRAGVGGNFIKLIAGSVAASLSGAGNLTVTKLQTELAPRAFDDLADRRELRLEVDELLAMELKRACWNIVTANERLITRDFTLSAAGGLVASGMNSAAAYIMNEVGEASEAVEGATTPESPRVVFRRPFAAAAAMIGTFAQTRTNITNRRVPDAVATAVHETENLDTGELDDQLGMLVQQLDQSLEGLRAKIEDDTANDAEKDEFDKLTIAKTRATIYRAGLSNRNPLYATIFTAENAMAVRSLRPAPPDDGSGPGTAKSSMSIAVRSTEWVGKVGAEVSGQMALVGEATAAAGVQRVSRAHDVRFRAARPDGVAFVQQSHLSFERWTAAAAVKAQLIHTGAETVDAAVRQRVKRTEGSLSTSTDAKFDTPGSWWFGALRYWSAGMYLDRDGTPLAGLGGVSVGASVRIAPLCQWADKIRTSRGGRRQSGTSVVYDDAENRFHDWLVDALGGPDRSGPAAQSDRGRRWTKAFGDFLYDAPLSNEHRLKGYPAQYDTVLVEACYRPPVGTGPEHVVAGDLDQVDLFESFDLGADQSTLPAQLANKRFELAALRLRLRISSDSGPMRRPAGPLGFALGTPFTLTFYAAVETTVEQEAIAEVHTSFFGDQGPGTPNSRYESTPPPVILFNRT